MQEYVVILAHSYHGQMISLSKGHEVGILFTSKGLDCCLFAVVAEHIF